jgi:hypothetical protein
MPIPELNQDGLLPPGIHECTLDELEARFDGGGFGEHRRYFLIRNLRTFLAEVRKVKFIAWVAVDGSFVTAKETPGDIDIVLVLDASFDPAFVPTQVEENVLSQRWVNRKFEFDCFWAVEGSDLFAKKIAFFQQVKHRSDLTKGLLKVIP